MDRDAPFPHDPEGPSPRDVPQPAPASRDDSSTPAHRDSGPSAPGSQPEDPTARLRATVRERTRVKSAVEEVRRSMRAYHLAATQGELGEVYNLASGQAQSVRGLLGTLLSYSKTEIRVERDLARYRPVDVLVVYGSSEKFHRRTGWEPQIPFEQTLRDTLEYWRGQVSK